MRRGFPVRSAFDETVKLMRTAPPTKRPTDVRRNILGSLTRHGESCRRCDGRRGWIGRRRIARSKAQLVNDARTCSKTASSEKFSSAAIFFLG